MSSPGRLDLEAAANFLDTVPKGRWTSYGDVAVAAGGASNGAQGIASWIGSKGHLVANVHRVLNSRGEINPGWTPAGPGLPSSAKEVEARLISEGLLFRNGRADPGQRRRAIKTERG